MEPLVYMIAILGCGDGGNTCTQARLDPARYTSLQACQAAAAITLARSTDLDFPELAAQCRRSGTRLAQNTRPRE